ncbi:hypothetical protein G114_15311 [Aeromonas diversa CDC 2478-85]|uniref:Lipoprotein n=1 Tax=Aeromonas diversa CDC 2478-85 TaxID=1268237 RepID=N9VI18_9GAMM|nr:hypothetical protein [Aeromonas diversa]ENY71051.1 hypothetical protein G114_15311 [Aeromonas diversa CDC 2478-85]
MKFRFTVLASTLALLSACGGGSDSTSPAPQPKPKPMAMPEVGVYLPYLLDGSNKALALDPEFQVSIVYPAGEQEQQWASLIALESADETTFLQLTGSAGRVTDESGRYTNSISNAVERIKLPDSSQLYMGDKIRNFDWSPLSRGSVTVEGLSALLWIADHETAYSNAGSSPSLVAGWRGKVALKPYPTQTLDSRNWSDEDGDNSTLVSSAETTVSGGKLHLALNLALAGCSLEGSGMAGSGLNRIDLSGLQQCRFDYYGDTSLVKTNLERVWLLALRELAKKQNTLTVYAFGVRDDENKPMLGIGVPGVKGMVLDLDSTQ